MKGLQKILDLIKKTGDRLIVLEMPSQTAYAVMNLADYERLWQSSQRINELTEEENEEAVEDDWLGSEQEELPGFAVKDDDWFGANDWPAKEPALSKIEDKKEEKEEENKEEKEEEDERYYFESLEP